MTDGPDSITEDARKTMRRIIERLAELDESQVSYEDGFGSVSCMFCGADRTCGETHKPDCLWIEARQLARNEKRVACDHKSTFSFGCTPGVTRCDKCGEVFGLEKALSQ